MVLRDDTTADLAFWGGTPERRRYLLQNWRADVTTLLNTLGEPAEWYRYSAYGTPTAHPIADVNGDGAVDSADVTIWNAIAGGDSSGAVWHQPDLNRDDVFPDQSDEDFFLAEHATASAAVTAGGKSGYQSQGVYNLRKGYAGYEWDRTLTMWHVRHRVLDSGSGKWTRRDPLGYVDGVNENEYARSAAHQMTDSSGLTVQWLGLLVAFYSSTRSTNWYSRYYQQHSWRPNQWDEIYRDWRANLQVNSGAVMTPASTFGPFWQIIVSSTAALSLTVQDNVTEWFGQIGYRPIRQYYDEQTLNAQGTHNLVTSWPLHCTFGFGISLGASLGLTTSESPRFRTPIHRSNVTPSRSPSLDISGHEIREYTLGLAHSAAVIGGSQLDEDLGASQKWCANIQFGVTGLARVHAVRDGFGLDWNLGVGASYYGLSAGLGVSGHTPIRERSERGVDIWNTHQFGGLREVCCWAHLK